MDDQDELRWKGLLGHTVCVLLDGGGSLECSDISSARKYANEHSAKNPRIYRKRGKKWVSVK